MEKAERDRLRELEARAIPGRWRVREGDGRDGWLFATAIVAECDAREAQVSAHTNEEFIAAARNALPRLLDYIDALEERIAKLTPLASLGAAHVPTFTSGPPIGAVNFTTDSGDDDADR